AEPHRNQTTASDDGATQTPPSFPSLPDTHCSESRCRAASGPFEQGCGPWTVLLLCARATMLDPRRANRLHARRFRYLRPQRACQTKSNVACAFRTKNLARRTTRATPRRKRRRSQVLRRRSDDGTSGRLTRVHPARGRPVIARVRSAALGQRHEHLVVRADVVGVGTDDLAVLALLDDVRAPAG